MNTKRQTIWLVSMLSLMVVLSAYYLFTDDSGSSKKPVADGQQVTKTDGTSSKETSSQNKDTGDEVVLNEVVTDGQVNSSGTDTAKVDSKNTSKDVSGDQAADTASQTAKDTSSKAAKDSAAKGAKDTAAAGTSKDDGEVLKEVASQSTVNDTFTNYQWQRAQNNTKEEESLMAIANDFSKDPDESAKAAEQLRALEEKEAKITNIEEQLQRSFANAMVQEDDNRYKVVVLSDKLEVSQAVSIVDMVMKELGVTQDKVSVQYVTE
ncbi:SpoIIIAH-like family protein [Paenibacillus sediminis]|uniref:Stage III sporulation protein AH n=1 Tax=Paenibacillus sediminis TaxID=664909 RepID=A0ABS4GZF0_9BACL|nr:SpoIIIAH-like family protein [Paenibacillus sediminis]MBP1935656.1 stage III sporulation protein AH [Paenibacillus sediminis]